VWSCSRRRFASAFFEDRLRGDDRARFGALTVTPFWGAAKPVGKKAITAAVDSSRSFALGGFSATRCCRTGSTTFCLQGKIGRELSEKGGRPVIRALSIARSDAGRFIPAWRSIFPTTRDSDSIFSELPPLAQSGAASNFARSSRRRWRQRCPARPGGVHLPFGMPATETASVGQRGCARAEDAVRATTSSLRRSCPTSLSRRITTHYPSAIRPIQRSTDFCFFPRFPVMRHGSGVQRVGTSLTDHNLNANGGRRLVRH